MKKMFDAKQRLRIAVAGGAALSMLVVTSARMQAYSKMASAPKMASAKMKMMMVPASDKKFMMAAAQGGMAEVMMGKLAAKKGMKADVKGFGQHMVMDHSKANAELKKVAMKKHVMLPKIPNAKQQATYKKLSGLKGAAFDRAYMADMVKDHIEDVADFSKEAKTGKDADAKGFAAKTLPTLKMHLSMAKSIHAKVK